MSHADAHERTFACILTDADMSRACAPEQPVEVRTGQDWMKAETGSVLPVKRIHGGFIDLGGDFYTVILSESDLRRDWFCIDAPDNVTSLAARSPSRTEREEG